MSARQKLSMSKLGLSAKCLYSFRADVPSVERPTGKAAALGSIVHALAEAHVTGKAFADDVDLTLLAEAKAIFDGPLRGFLDSHTWTVCERGYEYDSNADTCKDGPRRGELGYGDVPGHVLYGTVDLVHVEGDAAFVVDLKTGKPPSDAEQLYGQAVAISRRFGVNEVRVMYARALKTKCDPLDDQTLDMDRLDAEAGRIRRRLRLLPTAEPTPGEWCWKCDAWSSCPAQRNDEYVPPDQPPEPALYEYTRLF